MPLITGAIVGGAGLASSLIGGNKAAKAQKSAAKKQAALAREERKLFQPFYQSGVDSNNYLNMLMGTSGGENDTYDSLYNSMMGDFVRYKKKKSGGGLKGAIKGAVKGSLFGGGAALGAYSGLKGKKGYKTIFGDKEKAALDSAVKARMAQNQRNRENPLYGMLNKQFTGQDLEKDAGYQFRLGQGTQAIDRGAAARGGLFSGAAQKELQRFGQGLASDEFQNAWNRDMGYKQNLFNMYAGRANQGQAAAANQAGAMQNLSNVYGNMGDIQAAKWQSRSNAFNDNLGGAFNYWQSKSKV